MYDTAREFGASLSVKVDYGEFHGVIEVTGANTNWGLASESGYYEAEQLKAKAERERNMAEKTQSLKLAQEKDRKQRAQQPVNKRRAALEAKGNKLQNQQDDIFG